MAIISITVIAYAGYAALAIVLVWLFNVWGAFDFLFAYYQGLITVQLDARMLGAAYFIPTEAGIQAIFELN